MSVVLVICFIVLVVCVILQTIMMYSDLKISNTLTDNSNENKQLFIRLNDKGNSYISIDAIVGLGILKAQDAGSIYQSLKNKNGYVLAIQTDYCAFAEEFNTEEEARLRLEELLTIIEESYE